MFKSLKRAINDEHRRNWLLRVIPLSQTNFSFGNISPRLRNCFAALPLVPGNLKGSCGTSLRENKAPFVRGKLRQPRCERGSSVLHLRSQSRAVLASLPVITSGVIRADRHRLTAPRGRAEHWLAAGSFGADPTAAPFVSLPVTTRG